MPKYTNQIVVFLDVLGVKNMLLNFEEEALNHSDPASQYYHESERLNELLRIFKESIDLIKKADCSYYVFSDNICINISYLTDESKKPDVLVEMLILISGLINEFSKEGFFIRGGVDVGWFLNYPEIAIGVPLVRAYTLENRFAIYPRVLLSRSFTDLLSSYLNSKEIKEEFEDLAKLYIKSGRTFSFINPFFFILQYEEKATKIEFLKLFSRSINNQLDKKHKLRVRKKYIWLAYEFDSFVSDYLASYQDFENEEVKYSNDEKSTILESRIYNKKLPLWLTSIFPAFGRVSKK
jgi:hypothetical protein